MAKLSKAQAKAHREACKILQQDRLSEDDRIFVVENWHEGAEHIVGLAGAFFTPFDMAGHLSIEATAGRVIDLCAGIGGLSLALSMWKAREQLDLVCVELNEAYVSIGRNLLPEARWIVGDVFDVPAMGLGNFDCVISNPPFGATPRSRRSPRYTGKAFELHVIDIASDLAEWGAFIVPQQSAPFEYSGKPYYSAVARPELERFERETGVALGANCGIDCSVWRDAWRGVSVQTEIVTADFAQARSGRQPDLFMEAAE